MSKAVLISIKPYWCELIAGGRKTIEVRKTKPKLEPPFKCYIYCTKPSFPHEDYLVFDAGTNQIKAFYGGTKVIGEFVCDKVLDLHISCSDPSALVTHYEVPGTCLTDVEIMDYLGNGKTGYGWHISDLVIYDKPRELGECYRRCNRTAGECWDCHHAVGDECDCGTNRRLYLQRPPQSWCYVEEV